MTSPMFTRGFSFGMVSPPERFTELEGVILVANSRSGKGESAENGSNPATLRGKGRGNDEGRAETRPLSIRPKGDLILRRRHGDRLLQAKLQHGFAWNFDLLALGQDLSTRASCAACRRANGRAFTAAGNRANDGASHGADSSSLGSRGTLAFALQRVIAADDRIVLPVNHQAGQLELQLGMAGKRPAFLRFGQPAVNVGTLASHDGVADDQICLQAGVEDITHVVFRGVHAVNHAHEHGLPRRNGDVTASRGRGWCGRGCGCHGGSWGLSRSWRGASGAAGKGQCDNVTGAKSLHFPVHFKTKNVLCAAKIFPLYNFPAFKFQSVGGGHAHKKQRNCHRCKKTLQVTHASLSLDQIYRAG